MKLTIAILDTEVFSITIGRDASTNSDRGDTTSTPVGFGLPAELRHREPGFDFGDGTPPED